MLKATITIIAFKIIFKMFKNIFIVIFIRTQTPNSNIIITKKTMSKNINIFFFFLIW